jgi:hypothetical protein
MLRGTLRAARSFILKKRVLNLIVDAPQPFFRARGALAMVGGLYLKLSRPFFRGSKLRRKLMREIQGAGAVILRHLGYLVQQSNDRAPGVICHDVGVRLTLCYRRQRHNHSGLVGCRGVHYRTPLLLPKVRQLKRRANRAGAHAAR